MLLGAHVSPAGGPAKAIERGAERGARSIQIFNQNPRAWKPTVYDDAKVEAYHAAREGSGVEALLIHAVYLLNCASEDGEIVTKSRASLVGSLQAGERLGAAAVVLHPGSALIGGDAAAAVPRAGRVIAEALAETEGCPLHLENTAGAGGTLGRTFEELAALLDAAGDHERLGVCLDSCHLFASGYDVRTPEGLSEVLDEFDRVVGLSRLGSLHLNDSQVGLGANVDRHAKAGEGELGEAGVAAWLREPRFDGLPCVLETPVSDDPAESRAELARLEALRAG